MGNFDDRRRIFIYAMAGIAAALLFVRMRALFFLPDVEIPIFLYEKISRNVDDDRTVTPELFHKQMSDLHSQCYTTVSPARILAYKRWGFPLPDRPIIVSFDRGGRETLMYAAPVLKSLNMYGIVNLATKFISENKENLRAIDGEQMVSWEDVQAYMKSGVFLFGGYAGNMTGQTMNNSLFNEIKTSQNDIKKHTGRRAVIFSYPFENFDDETRRCAKKANILFAMDGGNKIATAGSHTDLLAMPRIRVQGGRVAFSVKIRSEKGPRKQGELLAGQPLGPRFPVCVLAYQNEDPNPVAEIELKELPRDPKPIAQLPVGVKYPVSVCVMDSTRLLLYMASVFPRYSIEYVDNCSFHTKNEKQEKQTEKEFLGFDLDSL